MLHNDLLARYPSLRRHQLVPAYQGAASEVQRMDAGDCDAAVVSLGYWFAACIGNITHPSPHCATKLRLLESVSTIPVAMPIRDEIAQGVSWRIAQEVARGRFSALEQEAKQNYTELLCTESSVFAGNGLYAFDLLSMSGPLLILISVATLSLLVTRVGRYTTQRADAIKAAIDTDGDGHVTRRELLRAATRGKMPHVATAQTDVQQALAAMEARCLTEAVVRQSAPNDPPANVVTAAACEDPIDDSAYDVTVVCTPSADFVHEGHSADEDHGWV
jgi:hypothetical protein